jgi:undecaprenyl diphosphate synthase
VENTFPKHVGIVLDGNRRWAKARGLKTIDGHKEGAEVFKRVSLAAFEKGVTYLSAFVFSTENWQRAKEEVSFLMKLVVRAVELHLDEFHKKNIKIIVVGSLENVPKSVLGAIRRTEEKTSANSGGTLALCFNYGGRTEIVDAAKAVLASGVAANDLTEDAFHTYLYKPELPDVDLLIRTSGEQRTSGFMLWRAAYAELLFVPKMWPDFTVEDLSDCLSEYSRRQRRFGK